MAQLGGGGSRSMFASRQHSLAADVQSKQRDEYLKLDVGDVMGGHVLELLR
jgi:hypothetical protein